MSDILAGVRSKLLTVSGVTDLIVSRIYFSNLPQAATLPAIVLELSVSSLIDRHLSATGTLYESSVNVYCYASTHTAAAALGDAVHTALEFGTGTWGTVTVKRCYVDNTQDVIEPPRDGSDAFRRIRGLLCSIWHN